MTFVHYDEEPRLGKQKDIDKDDDTTKTILETFETLITILTIENLNS